MFAAAAKLLLRLILFVAPAWASAQPFVWPSAWTDTPPHEAIRGGTLRDYSLSAPRTFNQLMSAEAGNPFFDWGLLVFRAPESGEWLPYAAESFTIDDSGTVVEVVLRDGMLWSDGSPVTVTDYYTTYLLETDPDVGATRSADWFMDGDPIRLEVTGERGLRFTFPRPDRLALPIVALGPTPDAIFGEAYRTGGAEAVRALWGAGVDFSETIWVAPFIPVSLVPNERLVMVANPTFGAWNVDEAGQPLPYLSGWVMTYTTEISAALGLFLAGELDVFFPRNLDDIGAINVAIHNGDIDAVVLESVGADFYSQLFTWNWNLASDPHKQALFRNVNFRRAMAHLLDRQLIADLVYNGAAQPTFGTIVPAHEFWVNLEIEKYPYDPARARQLLAEIGYEQRGPGAVMTNADGQPLRFTLATIAGLADFERVSQIFADLAREIGVEIDVLPLDVNLLVEQLLSAGDDRSWEAIHIGLSLRSRDWPFGADTLACGSTLHMYNRSDACISPLETLMAALGTKGRETLNNEAARQIAFEIQELEAQLLPILYVVSDLVHYSWSSSLGGVYPPDLLSAVVGPWELPLLYKR